jgi:ubiquinone/menaquinone biosynthesis C-methylase UbiE
MSQGEYQLGHDPAELDRLNEQGGLLAPATTMLLQAAGIRPGMRVLDLGSGSGDHTFAVAGLVGPDGSVAGVERSPEAVGMARARAERLGLANVTFTMGDIHDPAGGGPFDAVTGRLVLMYVPDPVAVLRTQAGVLRPGGLVAPVEFDVSTARTMPLVPLAVQAKGWITETFQRAGIEQSLGARLWQVLSDAGVRPAGMLGVQPHYGPDNPGGSALLGGIVRTLAPVMERTGVATAEEVGPDTLVGRVARELAAHQAVFAHPMLMSAWGTV